MIRRSYEAILLDLDGTLVHEGGGIRPRNLQVLLAAQERGVRVMLATGRSAGGARDILEQLENRMPALVFNGAGLYCPEKDRLIEERLLSNRVVERTLAFAHEEKLLPVVMRYGAKFGAAPRDVDEEEAVLYLEDLVVTPWAELPREFLIRITLFSRENSAELARRLDRALDLPVYLTDFPLNTLPQHRRSRLSCVDIQPPCRGKGEALRYLLEEHGIEPERVVAVGDAQNDVPMIRAAGLGVAMGNATPEVRRLADRVIGTNETDAIAELVEELFP